MNWIKGVCCIVLLGSIVACNPEEFKVDNVGGGGNTVNRTLIVTTQHRYNMQLRLDSLVPDVTIEMYLDPLDRTERVNVDRIRSTDSLGISRIEYLEDTTYYLRLEHTELGVLLEQVNITSNTLTAYEYFLY